eukprot:TRINITY_DN5443_c0_g1_i1.p1 TRINITY_DN5443_c0_g1~~TRINITY_DN5443_c0_g1_i1.p1  ORF type:complete len:424 (+),score=119.50 TRINITY_DN5443_c0_g1_i1:251-1522(+)
MSRSRLANDKPLVSIGPGARTSSDNVGGGGDGGGGGGVGGDGDDRPPGIRRSVSTGLIRLDDPILPQLQLNDRVLSNNDLRRSSPRRQEVVSFLRYKFMCLCAQLEVLLVQPPTNGDGPVSSATTTHDAPTATATATAATTSRNNLEPIIDQLLLDLLELLGGLYVAEKERVKQQHRDQQEEHQQHQGEECARKDGTGAAEAQRQPSHAGAQTQLAECHANHLSPTTAEDLVDTTFTFHDLMEFFFEKRWNVMFPNVSRDVCSEYPQLQQLERQMLQQQQQQQQQQTSLPANKSDLPTFLPSDSYLATITQLSRIVEVAHTIQQAHCPAPGEVVPPVTAQLAQQLALLYQYAKSLGVPMEASVNDIKQHFEAVKHCVERDEPVLNDELRQWLFHMTTNILETVASLPDPFITSMLPVIQALSE